MKDSIILFLCLGAMVFLLALQFHIDETKNNSIANLKYENKMYKELIEKLKNDKTCDEQFFQLKDYTIYILEENIKLYKKVYENNN
jgi:hypothetical protein